MSALAAVPWQVWVVLALLGALAACGGWFAWQCAHAPMDTDLWPSGEPSEVRGIRVNPGREEW